MNLKRKFFQGLVAIALASLGLAAQAGTAAYYIYDESGHVIGEYDANGNPVQEHIYLGDKPVAVVQNGNTATLDYVTTDQLGTPRVVTNSSQAIVWQWNSDPFGNGQPTGSLSYNLRFPGQYYDSETGHNYNYKRDYDPSTARYIESDPIGLKGGVNTFTYVGDNPLTRTDRLGLAWSCSCQSSKEGGANNAQMTAKLCRYSCNCKCGSKQFSIIVLSYSTETSIDNDYGSLVCHGQRGTSTDKDGDVTPNFNAFTVSSEDPQSYYTRDVHDALSSQISCCH